MKDRLKELYNLKCCKENDKYMKKFQKILIAVLIIIAVFFVGGLFFLRDRYNPNERALRCLENETNGVTIITEDNGNIVFMPDNPKVGFIFYPGVKVDNKSYSTLLTLLAENGICCIDIKNLFNIPILNINAADKIKEEFPQISTWYIGGHSMGGSVSAMYVAKNDEDFEGIILLGSYSTVDLSDKDISALLIYGENDGVLDMGNFEKYKENLPKKSRIVCIPGGCHAGFGDYGVQKGDGLESITAEEQQKIATEIIKSELKVNRNETYKKNN